MGGPARYVDAGVHLVNDRAVTAPSWRNLIASADPPSVGGWDALRAWARSSTVTVAPYRALVKGGSGDVWSASGNPGNLGNLGAGSHGLRCHDVLRVEEHREE